MASEGVFVAGGVEAADAVRTEVAQLRAADAEFRGQMESISDGLCAAEAALEDLRRCVLVALGAKHAMDSTLKSRDAVLRRLDFALNQLHVRLQEHDVRAARAHDELVARVEALEKRSTR